MGRTRGETRQRMLDSAIVLLRERGAAGVSIDAVLAHSGAPRGSVYHHFPGGRDELILAAVRHAGDHTANIIDAATVADGEPVAVLEKFARFWKNALVRDGYRAGCPIVALAVAHREDLPEAAAVVDDIFAVWQTKLGDLLHASGVPTARAVRLATLAVAAIEGAIILCRAHRDTRPLDDVMAELGPLFR